MKRAIACPLAAFLAALNECIAVATSTLRGAVMCTGARMLMSRLDFTIVVEMPDDEHSSAHVS